VPQRFRDPKMQATFGWNEECCARQSLISSLIFGEHYMNASVQTLPRSRSTTSSDSNGRSRQLQTSRGQWKNVGDTERLVSASAGTILVAQGLARRDLVGLLIAGVGGALATAQSEPCRQCADRATVLSSCDVTCSSIFRTFHTSVDMPFAARYTDDSSRRGWQTLTCL
jgi:hypothetical protein